MHRVLTKAALLFAACFMLFLPSLSFAASSGDGARIRILHVNDFHGFAKAHKAFGSDEIVGGLAYLAGRAGELQKERPGLFLAAGDMIQGNNWTNLFQGKPVIEAMNVMGFDAMVVGNHEFDFGQEILARRIREARFPILGANVVGVKGLKPYLVKTVQGVRIAVIGVVTEDVPISTHPRNVAGLTFLPPEKAVEKYISELKGRADIIVVLSHMGFNIDMLLAERTKGIDVIVGGHTHTKLESFMRVGNTIIVQAWERGLALGVLDLTVQKGKIVRAESRIEEIKPGKTAKNEKVADIVDEYAEKTDDLMKEKVGEATVDLDGKDVRLRETNLGNLIADALREKAGSDGAIINGGGIRTSINKGPITVGDVYSVVPFDNYVVAFKLTGKQVREALEHGVAGVENKEGQFPQVSGITFTYTKAAPKGSRVKEVLIRGKPLEPGNIYTIATNDFLAAGGDGYKSFGEAVKGSKDYAVVGGSMKGENLIYSDSGKWIRDVIIDYIRAKKKVAPATEGRIREVP